MVRPVPAAGRACLQLLNLSCTASGHALEVLITDMGVRPAGFAAATKFTP